MTERKASRSRGNVFADIGVREPEDALIKAELARQISSAIMARGLTQVAAARLVGVDQPKVSALLSGRLGGFSIERLMKFLNSLGLEIEIRVKAVRAGRVAHTRIVTGG